FSAEQIWDSWITLRSFSIGAGLREIYEDHGKRVKLKPAAIYEIERGMAMSAFEIHKASEARSAWFGKAVELFETFDVLVLPSAQVFPFDVRLEHPLSVNGQEMDTYHRWMEVVIAASLIGLPVVNVPIGFGGASDLPMGVQLIGKRGSDAKLLQIANAWHQATQWPERRRPAL
ncbi:MAG: amidase family protein, partial [Lentilitoribacter sp.]